MVEKRLAEIDFHALLNRSFTKSPVAWEDQVLYFVMLDRFSDGREQGYLDNAGRPVTGGQTPPFQPADAGSALQNEQDSARWREAGTRWAGGTLRGLTSKLGYLKRLGVTALWVSPIFRQVAFQDTYHGYGIQNFLDVDPHFGTRQDLKRLVAQAHKHGIYVILDIILNHTGNVFRYAADRNWKPLGNGQGYFDNRWDGGEYAVAGWHDAAGQPSLPFGPVDLTQHPDAWPAGAIWPTEFQEPDLYTRRGYINNWDNFPEYLEGDFYDLKDVNLGDGSVEDYAPSAALHHLCEVYKFWIAYADIDGYRVDTVKHMDPGAVRYLNSVMHEFSQSIGKENFYLIGEITGGRSHAFITMETTGLDAALGIDDIPQRIEYLVKGYSNPREYFDLFRNSMLMQKDSHTWFRNKVVTLFDDHDQVRKGSYKARFCAGSPEFRKLLLNVLALNTTTLGIPCIYYGTEQGFDGQGDGDRYIRESMFGGEFGAFGSRGRHFFNESEPVYQELAKILALRKQKIALRRGRQYLRPISGDGVGFGYPQVWGGRMLSIVPWTRHFDDQHILLALNTDPNNAQQAWVALGSAQESPSAPTALGNINDGYMTDDQPVAFMSCLYSTDPAQIGQTLPVHTRSGYRSVLLSVPPAGFVIFE